MPLTATEKKTVANKTKKPQASAKKKAPPAKGATKPTEASQSVKKEPKAKKPEARQVLYPKIEVALCSIGTGNPLTAEKAKDLLGWVAEEGSEKFGTDFLLVDEYGKKVRCHNNVSNRPLYLPVVQTLKQEILNQRWKLNGETMIIGATGLTLNCQHRLVGLVLACQEWAKDPKKWSDWKEEPTLDTVVVRGIDESDTTVNTMDTCKPRSLADVLYRSEFFNKLSIKERKEAAKMLSYAIMLLWDRTGAKKDAYAPLRTHSESLDFVERHKKILDCIQHIMEENKEGQITRYLQPGTAAGFLYLMGSSATDPAKYRKSETPRESMLDWKRWDDARDFWTRLGGGDKSLATIRTALSEMLNSTGGSATERKALIAKAWNVIASGKSLTAESLKLAYEEDRDEQGDLISRTLAESPTLGGIDAGAGGNEAWGADTVEDGEVSEESPKQKPAGNTPAPSKSKHKPELGEACWVVDAKGQHWQGVFKSLDGTIATVQVMPGFKGAGMKKQIPVESLQSDRPA